MSKETIEAMKQMADKLEADGHYGHEQFMREAIAREEAQSVEPTEFEHWLNLQRGMRVSEVFHEIVARVARPAPAKQPLDSEREALIERLRDYTNCNDSDVDDASDMLEADNDLYDLLQALTKTCEDQLTEIMQLKSSAQQVAVQHGPEKCDYARCKTHGCDGVCLEVNHGIKP